MFPFASRFLSVELQVKRMGDSLVNEWALGAARISGGRNPLLASEKLIISLTT